MQREGRGVTRVCQQPCFLKKHRIVLVILKAALCNDFEKRQEAQTGKLGVLGLAHP